MLTAFDKRLSVVCGVPPERQPCNLPSVCVRGVDKPHVTAKLKPRPLLYLDWPDRVHLGLICFFGVIHFSNSFKRKF